MTSKINKPLHNLVGDVDLVGSSENMDTLFTKGEEDLEKGPLPNKVQSLTQQPSIRIIDYSSEEEEDEREGDISAEIHEMEINLNNNKEINTFSSPNQNNDPITFSEKQEIVSSFNEGTYLRNSLLSTERKNYQNRTNQISRITEVDDEYSPNHKNSILNTSSQNVKKQSIAEEFHSNFASQIETQVSH